MTQPVIKSGGTTPSEKYLADLCEKSFLRLWSYPNAFRDQGCGETGIGKELCDLLVVCGNNVIIFSDKSCAIQETSVSDVAWSRWYKRAIKKSADQIYGAERWIRNHPGRIFIDDKCQDPFPFSLPDENRLQIFRIVVALGAKSRCQRELNGSGSLWLKPSINAGDHAFHVGTVNPEKGFVHVLDDVSLSIILKELDTITDFLNYLGLAG